MRLVDVDEITPMVTEILKSYNTSISAISDVEMHLDSAETPKEVIELESKMKRIEMIVNLFETTFDWGCNDDVRAALPNALYECVHPDNKAFKGSVDNFIECVTRR